MPLYDFECQKCKRVFEELLPIGTKTLPACPACKSKQVQKLLTPPAVHFKGEGFYKTDSSKSVSTTKKTPEAESTAPVATKTEPVESKDSKKEAKSSIPAQG